MMSSVYALKPNIALASRQAAVPELHLQLENWYHDLASPLRASTNVVSKAPHPLIIGESLQRRFGGGSAVDGESEDES